MIVAILSTLEYVENPDEHTVRYSDYCKELEFTDRANYGNFKAVIAKDDFEAEEKIRKQVLDYLRIGFGFMMVNPKDFRFEFRFSDVKNNEFWLIPSVSTCRSYPVMVQ